MTTKQKKAAELFAVGNISWKDVEWLCGHIEPKDEEEMRNYAAEYAVKIDILSANWNLKKGPKAIIEHAHLMCEEYDLNICDLTVKEVVNSYYAYAATGYIVY